MFTYLVNHNSYITSVYMEVIFDIKYKIHHLNLEGCFVQQEKENNFQYLC